MLHLLKEQVEECLQVGLVFLREENGACEVCACPLDEAIELKHNFDLNLRDLRRVVLVYRNLDNFLEKGAKHLLN